MSRSALSMLVFGVYLIGLGAVLMITPNTLLGLFGLPATNEVWIRVVGLLVTILAFYYTMAARADLRQLFLWSAIARSAVILVFAVFVVAGLVSPLLILFGAFDLVGAIWTFLALRADRKTATA